MRMERAEYSITIPAVSTGCLQATVHPPQLRQCTLQPPPALILSYHPKPDACGNGNQSYGHSLQTNLTRFTIPIPLDSLTLFSTTKKSILNNEAVMKHRASKASGRNQRKISQQVYTAWRKGFLGARCTSTIKRQVTGDVEICVTL